MPSGTHSVVLDIPVQDIWHFVKDMNNWAPLVPGYINHNILSDKQSTWTFKGDLGVVKKKVKLQIDITQWKEPTSVTFNLTGLNENFSGSGYFQLEPLSDTQTKMTGNLNIKAKGMMGPLVNPALKSFVPKTAKELTNAVAKKLVEIETAKNR